MLPSFRSCAACGLRLQDSQPLCGDCRRDLAVNRAPTRCRRCSIPLAGPVSLCQRCRSVEFGFDAHVSACFYTDSAASVVRAYKFGGRRSLARFLVSILYEALPGQWAPDAVIPVPSRPKSVRKRGFDAVGKLASGLADISGLPALRLLQNVGRTEQKGLGYTSRVADAALRFSVREGFTPGATFLLVDDVFTTGATLSACAAALTGAGALRVYALSLVMEL